jgi:hypothetical protein
MVFLQKMNACEDTAAFDFAKKFNKPCLAKKFLRHFKFWHSIP